MKKKKILVVLTGGTIGSKVEGDLINVSSRSPYRLISMYEEQYGKETEFEIINPLNILSENMTPDTLLMLLKALDKVTYENYSGVIVTHGSDTLSYTAAFAGLLFHHVPVPFVLVASNYPLGQPGSNGLDNFAKAVELIRGNAVRGVFVLYRDKEEKSQVYLATRILEADPYLDQFRDFSGQAFGRMEEGRFIWQESSVQPSIEEVEACRKRQLQVPECFDRKVLLIRPYPGMDYTQFDLSDKPAAVLHYLYHSATACIEGEQYNMLLFAKKCRALGIDFYAASYKQVEGKQYATANCLLKEGIRPLLNISPEAAYAKLMLIYNQRNKKLYELLDNNLYFETIEKKD